MSLHDNDLEQVRMKGGVQLSVDRIMTFVKNNAFCDKEVVRYYITGTVI